MKLLIYGAGGLARELYDIVIRSTPDRYEKIYLIDDFATEGDSYLSESIHFDSIPQIFKDDLEELEGIVGVGEPAYRENLTKKFDSLGIRLATVVDATALVSSTAVIEEGAIICEFASIHANVHIGRSALIQPYCAVGHDVKFGDYSVMSSNCSLGGGVF